MNNFERFKAEKGRLERKKAKEGRVDGGGRKAFPTRGSQGVRRGQSRHQHTDSHHSCQSHFQSNMQGKTKQRSVPQWYMKYNTLKSEAKHYKIDISE